MESAQELMEDAEVKDGIFVTPVVLRGHSYWATDKKIAEEMKNGTEIWIKSESFVPYYKKKKVSIKAPCWRCLAKRGVEGSERYS